jgi:hypothetical protein
VWVNTGMKLTLTDLLLEDDGFTDHRFHDLQAPPPGDPSLKAWLEQTFGDEDAYGGRIPDEDEGEASTLANGGDWAICTSWARMVNDALPGRGRVHGFWIDDNPEATELAKYCDGHDFAVVDDQFIVDGWAKHVEGITRKVVFDMKDPTDRAIILGMYGNPSSWKSL